MTVLPLLRGLLRREPTPAEMADVVAVLESLAELARADGGLTRPELRRGAAGAAVKRWQELLVACGEDVGPSGVDGDFGKITEAATKRFQAAAFGHEPGAVGMAEWLLAAAIAKGKQ